MHYRRFLRGQDLSLPKRTGGFVKYQMAHHRVRAVYGKASQYRCADCLAPAREWSYDGGDPNELREHGSLYSLEPRYYKPRCVTCHRKMDLGRNPVCHVIGCDTRAHARDLCKKHYDTVRNSKVGVS